MTYTDTQLKRALAEMLPKVITHTLSADKENLFWIPAKNADIHYKLVLDTELLHLCWLAEEELTDKEQYDYQIYLYCIFDTLWTYEELSNMCFEVSWLSTWAMSHATWQQRIIALAKVKGIEIV